MTRTTHNRLAKLEEANKPPEAPRTITLIAADDPDAERLIAEHGAQDPLRPTLIILTGVHRSPGFLEGEDA